VVGVMKKSIMMKRSKKLKIVLLVMVGVNVSQDQRQTPCLVTIPINVLSEITVRDPTISVSQEKP
jgi:hypothetical protein